MEQEEEAAVPRSERFEIVRCIGIGGMGVVYEALDRTHCTRVALKTLRTTDPDALRRLKREFREVRDIHHPNLVRLGELVEEGGVWFFTMELVDGLPFLEYVRPARTLDVERLRTVLPELVRGLAALHDAGCVHRDVKPSNVLVVPSGRVVLLDFGLITSWQERSNWSQQQIVGTAAYMAPEQAAARAVGPEADWYSVGVMLYEALTGQLPFDGMALHVLMEKQAGTPRAPRELADVPADLDELCMRLLANDPAQRPTAADLVELLGGRKAVPVRPSTPSAMPFVGRSDELATLRDARIAGSLRAVLVEGESGIGKTSLLRRFAEDLAQDNVVVLRGRCYERESIPYRAIDGIIDELARYVQSLPRERAAALVPRQATLLTQVFPVLRGVDVLAEAPRVNVADPQELRSRLFAATRELFARLAERTPVALLIDDLQWADSDSIALLAGIATPPDAPPLLLVGTWRSVAKDPALPSGLDRMPCAWQRIALGPLPDEHARELATLLLDRAGQPLQTPIAAELAAEAAGHPLFIDALVHHASSASDELPIPTRLDEALLHRVTQLDPDSRAILELAAIAGTPVDLESLSIAANRTLAQVAESADVLRLAHLVAGAGRRVADCIEPYHDRVRHAVLDGVADERRPALHRELARALEATGRGEAETLAAHHRSAGDPARAGLFATRAAEEASRVLAFDRASALYKTALELLGPDHHDRFLILIKLGEELQKSGHGREAADAFLEAAPHVDELRAFELRQRACEQLMVTGHLEESLTEMRRVLAAFGMTYPATPRRALVDVGVRRARLALKKRHRRPRSPDEVTPRDRARIELCLHAAIGLGTVDNVRGHAFHLTSLLLSLDRGDANQLSRALALDAVFRACTGKRARKDVEKVLDLAHELAVESGAPHPLYTSVACRALCALVTGRFGQALDGYRRADRILREQCVGTFAWQRTVASHWLAMALLYTGSLQELSRHLPVWLREAEDHGNVYGMTTAQVATLPFVLHAADQPDRAMVEIDAGMARWKSSGTHLQHYYELTSRASTLLYRGESAAALRLVNARIPALREALLLRITFVAGSVAELQARAALACAVDGSLDPREAERYVERSTRLLERLDEPWFHALATALRGGIAALARDPASAESYASAARMFDSSDMSLHAAAARIRADRDADDARRWLAEQGVVASDRIVAQLLPVAIR